MYGLHESFAAVPVRHNETPYWAGCRFNWVPASRAAAVTAVCFALRPSEAFRVGFFKTAGIRQQHEEHRHCCRTPTHRTIGCQRRGTASTVAVSMCDTAGKGRAGLCDRGAVFAAALRVVFGLESLRYVRTRQTMNTWKPHVS